ncbi:unnamed protein product [Pedinophyceae sp. YPF-701]|nr:unnamed protein product [Pedinophyceae sp. YPF-701]
MIAQVSLTGSEAIPSVQDAEDTTTSMANLKFTLEDAIKLSLSGAVQFSGPLREAFLELVREFNLWVSQRAEVANMLVQHALLLALEREEQNLHRALDIESDAGVKSMYLHAMTGTAQDIHSPAFAIGLKPSFEKFDALGLPATLAEGARMEGDIHAFNRVAGDLARAFQSLGSDVTFKARQRKVIRALLLKMAPDDTRDVRKWRLRSIVDQINGDPPSEDMKRTMSRKAYKLTRDMKKLIKEHRAVLKPREWVEQREASRLVVDAATGLGVGWYKEEKEKKDVVWDEEWRKNHPWEVVRYYAFLLRKCDIHKLKLRRPFTLALRPHVRRQYVPISPEVLQGLLRACRARVSRADWEAHFGPTDNDLDPLGRAGLEAFKKRAANFWWPKVFVMKRKLRRERRDTVVPRGKVAKGDKTSGRKKKTKSRFEEPAHTPDDDPHRRMRGAGGWTFSGLVATDGVGIDFHFSKKQPRRTKARKVSQGQKAAGQRGAQEPAGGPLEGQCVVGVDLGRINISQAVVKRPDGEFIVRPAFSAARYHTESGQRRRARRTRGWGQERVGRVGVFRRDPKSVASRTRSKPLPAKFAEVMQGLATSSRADMEKAVKAYGPIRDDIWRLRTQLKWARERFRAHRLSQKAISRDLRGAKRCCARDGDGKKRPPHLMACGDAAFPGTGRGCLPVPLETYRRKAKLTFQPDFKAVAEDFTTRAHWRCRKWTVPAHARRPDASHDHVVHDVRWCPICEQKVARDKNAAKNMAEAAAPDRPAYLCPPGEGGGGGGGVGGGGQHKVHMLKCWCKEPRKAKSRRT